jgi:hypothetical protein
MSEEQGGTVPNLGLTEEAGREPAGDASAADGHILSDHADLARAFANSLAEHPQIFGGSDILTLEVFGPADRAGILAAALTMIS